MAWMNVASTRFETRTKLTKSLGNWEHEEELVGTHNLGLYALMNGRKDAYDRTKRLTSKWLSHYLSKNDKTLAQPNVFPVFANLCVLDIVNGNRSTDHLRRTIDLKLPKHPALRSLQKILAKAVNRDFSKVFARKPRPGHVDGESAWLKLVDSGNLRNLLDLALCPDHPLWLTTLSDFCLPLALLLHEVGLAEGNDTSIEDYLRLGARPESHRQVLFERTTRKPPIDADVLDDPKTWPGFDAIEYGDDTLYVYHWLGFSWRASLDFEPHEKLNAFRPLMFAELGWKLVEEQVEPRNWARIERHRRDGEVVHVLVHDRRHSEADELEIRKASEALKMDIRASDFAAI